MNCCVVPVETKHASVVSPAICTSCGKRGNKVERRTLEHLIKSDSLKDIAESQHYFCKTPTCEVVYFDGKGSVFPKAALTVRVGLKETEDPVPVCYCFGFTRKMMRDEIARQGETTIPETIKKEIQAGNCACDVKNPSGRCCLGEVIQLAKEICTDSLNKAQVRPCCVPPIQVTQKISDRRG